MQDKEKVPVYFCRHMLLALADDPERASAEVERAGIDPAVLDDPTARIPAEPFARLWLNLIDRLDDEFFRLDRHGMPRGSFALICRGLIQEPTLERALRQCIAYFRLFLHEIDVNLSQGNGRTVIALISHHDDPLRQSYAEELYLVLLISLLCWLGGEPIAVLKARFAQPRLALDNDALLWGPDLQLGQGPTEVQLPSTALRRPVIQDLASLKQFLRSAPHWLVIRYRNRASLSARVYRRLRSAPVEAWPTLPALARELSLSATTLRRQLQREGHAFQALKDEVRRAMACDLLREGDASVADIAARTGFAEPSAFHRAFRKWTGTSPGGYRQGTRTM